MNNYDIIKQAIQERQIIIANYQGFRRELCPHALGTKKGRLQALFYQCGGYTSKGPVQPGSTANWRCLPIETIEIIEVSQGEFESISDHSKTQSCIDDIHIQIQY